MAPWAGGLVSVISGAVCSLFRWNPSTRLLCCAAAASLRSDYLAGEGDSALWDAASTVPASAGTSPPTHAPSPLQARSDQHQGPGAAAPIDLPSAEAFGSVHHAPPPSQQLRDNLALAASAPSASTLDSFTAAPQRSAMVAVPRAGSAGPPSHAVPSLTPARSLAPAAEALSRYSGAVDTGTSVTAAAASGVASLAEAMRHGWRAAQPGRNRDYVASIDGSVVGNRALLHAPSQLSNAGSATAMLPRVGRYGIEHAGELVLAFRGMRVRMGIHSGVSDESEVRCDDATSATRAGGWHQLPANFGCSAAPQKLTRASARAQVSVNKATGRVQYSGAFMAAAKAVCDAAHGGQVLLSTASFKALAPGQLVSSAFLLHMGQHVVTAPEAASSAAAPPLATGGSAEAARGPATLPLSNEDGTEGEGGDEERGHADSGAPQGGSSSSESALALVLPPTRPPAAVAAPGACMDRQGDGKPSSSMAASGAEALYQLLPYLLACRLPMFPPPRTHSYLESGLPDAPVGAVTICFMYVTGVSALNAWNKEVAAQALDIFQELASECLVASNGYKVGSGAQLECNDAQQATSGYHYRGKEGLQYQCRYSLALNSQAHANDPATAGVNNDSAPTAG